MFISLDSAVLPQACVRWIPPTPAAAQLLAHRFPAAWTTRTNRHWIFSSTFCLLLAVPGMLVIAFIVPGVL
jgi:hypothetical protein